MDDYIGRDLKQKLANPLVFQRKGAAAENPVGDRAHGYDATEKKGARCFDFGLWR